MLVSSITPQATACRLIMSVSNDSLTLMNNLTKEGQKMDKLNEALEALQQANKMFAEMFDIDESEAE
jgi:hypothetical protein